MAGIVASTLRRKAFHKKTLDTRYQAIDQDPVNVITHSSSSSSSLDSLAQLGYRSAVSKPPRGAQLCYQDFWPRCLNSCYANEPNIGYCTKEKETVAVGGSGGTSGVVRATDKNRDSIKQQQQHCISNNSNNFNYNNNNKTIDTFPKAPVTPPRHHGILRQPSSSSDPLLGESKMPSSAGERGMKAGETKVKTKTKDTKSSAIAQLVVRNNALLAKQQLRQQIEDNITLAQFESFDTLVPRANAWLQENSNCRIIKCETLEKKINSMNDVVSGQVMFVPRTKYAIYLKGLRLWYINTDSYIPKPKQPRHHPRSQHLSTTTLTTTIAPNATPSKSHQGILKRHQQEKHPAKPINQLPPLEIGYMNVIPRCLDGSKKYPVYEDLPETFSAINAYLASNPLEGKIITIETVSLRLPKRQWSSFEIKPDQTSFPDEFVRHTLYITRIYFCYGPPEVELIGAQDFLPDIEENGNWKTLYKSKPRYLSISTALDKAKEWIESVRNIAVTNIQTLEMAYRYKPGTHVHTGVNFIEKSESTSLVRFIRVAYVRPSDDLAELLHSIYSPPTSLASKTFVPAPLRVAMCSGSPHYEAFNSTWERAKMWLRSVDRRVVSVESFYHPLHKVWHLQDGAETTVISGEWSCKQPANKKTAERKQLVNIVRVYMDGDFQEPPPHTMPPLPLVEEVNDCRCLLS